MKAGRTETKLVEYYQQERDALLNEGGIFAQRHPDIAQSLGMGPGRSPDPQVELLLQSFAFLSGRLRYGVEVDTARLPNALAESLYPNLSAPVPSMVMAQISNVAKTQSLPRGQGICASAQNDVGQQIDCRFRTCFETPLLPLSVMSVQLCEPDHVALATLGKVARSVLRIRIRKNPAAKLAVLGSECLRFFIDTETVPSAFDMYELLALHLTGIAIDIPSKASVAGVQRALDAELLRWLGYDDDEAILYTNSEMPPAYRLLQEYFAFQQKFLFFEIDQVDLSAAQDYVDVLFGLDVPFEREMSWPADSLRLNCVPLVNLFSQHIEPIALDHTETEYRLIADLEQHRYNEIYLLEKLYSICSDGSMRTIEPYFGIDQLVAITQPDYFYLGRRERSEATNVAGGEYFVSFLDQKFNLTVLMDEVIGGTALCTNRRLPEQLRIGSELQLEGAGPAVTIATIGKPTSHDMPDQIGQRPWLLVSQLALNRLSLADGPAALTALKEILRLHVGPNRIVGLRQIDGILGLTCRTVMRNHPQWRGFVRATHVHLTLDGHSFTAGSPVLFWNVLRRFFALYITVNNLVESSFETNDCSGNDAAWKALSGAKCVL